MYACNIDMKYQINALSILGINISISTVKSLHQVKMSY